MQAEQEFYYQAAVELKWNGNNEDAGYQGICTDIFDPETNKRITIQLKDLPKLKLFLDRNVFYSFDELAAVIEEN